MGDCRGAVAPTFVLRAMSTVHRPSNHDRSDASDREGSGERQRQLALLLDQLDAREAAEDARVGRRNTRASYRRSDVHIVVHHPGGSDTERRVFTRDLSAGGMSFIHGGYLHVGTRVDVGLHRYVGGDDEVSGVVRHCDHIAGSWHAVGVKFEQRVFPKLYLDPEHAATMIGDVRDPSSIVGRVLLLDDSDLDRRLIAHHLRHTRIELVGVGRLDQACEALANQTADRPFGLVIVDLHLADDEATIAPEEVVRRSASMGVARVAVCTAETDPRRLRSVREAGAVGVLTKPLDGAQVVGQIAAWLGEGESGNGKLSCDGEDRIYSELTGQPGMESLVVDFVTSAHRSVNALGRSIEEGSLERCRALCVRLRGTGTSFGFACVTEAASEAVKSLDATMSVDESLVQIQRLQDTCSRLSADPPTNAAAA